MSGQCKQYVYLSIERSVTSSTPTNAHKTHSIKKREKTIYLSLVMDNFLKKYTMCVYISITNFIIHVFKTVGSIPFVEQKII